MSMNPSAFNKIIKGYDQRKMRNQSLLKERKDKVFSEIPLLREIHNKVATLGLSTATAVMESPSKREAYLEDLADNIRLLSEHKKQLLVDHGYPADYLEPIYHCPDCQDTGYIGNMKCHCLKQAMISVAYEQSNLKNVLSKENFGTFSLDYYDSKPDPTLGISPRQNMLSILDQCLDFVEHFEKPFTNLILYGQSGLGKTFLCNAIAKALLDQGKTVVYLPSFQLFRLFENYRFHNDDQAFGYEEIANLYSCDLLIIDDLGTEVINTFTSSELFNCLNTRLLNQKSTVISTNLESREWSNQYSERIVSRIFGFYKPLRFIGTDIRLLKYR